MSPNRNTYWRAMSHFGRFRVEGQDAPQLLHHLTTNNIKRLKSGEGCDAVLITNKARVLDWLTIWREGDAYEVLTSPNRRALFVPHAQKFILFRQEVRFADVTESRVLFGLFGAATREVLAAWSAAEVCEAPLNARLHAEVEGVKIWLSRTRRLPAGRSLGEGVLVGCEDRAALEKLIERSQIPLCDDATYNTLRVEAGIPVAGLELTEEINPWEAGLDFAISLDKGCYNGQEVVARLHTYQKIKQKLFGVKLEKPLAMQEVTAQKVLLKNQGRDAGFLTSSVDSPRFGPIALGYVRTDFREPGRALEVLASPTQQGIVAALPFDQS